MACSRHVFTCGMGKAGIVAQKIAATLSSTGTPAFYLHPADALHGDLGMVGEGDVVLILSNSGESEEITRLLPCLRRVGAKLVAITSSDRSTLAAYADEVITLGLIHEACPLGLAPSATTTAMLALGDAISLTLMKKRNFEEKDYAKLHPAGALGRRLLPVEDVMRIGDAVARVGPDTLVKHAILAITKARAGAAVVVDTENRVVGIFVDGDLRRGIETGPEFLDTPVGKAMSSNCTIVKCGVLAGQVLDMMREKRIADVPVVDDNGCLLGVADLKGLVASM
jgi:arabinose-5-phosphate isomerase